MSPFFTSFLFFVFFLLAFVADASSNSSLLSAQLSEYLIRKYGESASTLNATQLDKLVQTIVGCGAFLAVPRGNECSSQNSRLCNITNQCLSTSQLLQWIHHPHSEDDDLRVDGVTLTNLCPLLLVQKESGVCSGKVNSIDNQTNNLSSTGKTSYLEVWGYGLLFVTIISLCSLVGVIVLPVMEKKLYQRLLTFLIGLAVGSLSSSAVFHLIPQAFDLIPENDDSHAYLFTSLFVMGGIYLFFMTECLMKILIEARKRVLSKLLRNCSDVDTLRSLPATVSEEFQRSVGDLSSNYSLQKQISEITSPQLTLENSVAINMNKNHKHDHHIEFKQGENSAIATVAWMIVFGDGLHNFIDGLSIGAAFNKSILTGISISVAVLCEEFPHELGDFAVLLNAGMTMKQALLYNLLSACTCYLGLVVGILLGELTATSTYIFALAGGMFLYISLVDMIPEMNEILATTSQQSVQKALHTLLLQNLGWMTGVTILFTLAYYNKDIKFD